MIKFKSGSVNIKVFTPALSLILYRLEFFHRNRLTEQPEDIVITSVNDSVHGENSKHYIDQAIDIRSKNFPSSAAKAEFRKEFERVLGPDEFTVIIENLGTENEHFHVQVKKGRTFP